MPYASPYGNDVARLIVQQGQNQANAIRERGAAIANGVDNIGRLASRTFADLIDYKQSAPQRALAQQRTYRDLQALSDEAKAKEALKSSVNPETGVLDKRAAAQKLQAIDPVQASKFYAEATDDERKQLDYDKRRADVLASSAGSILAAPPEQRGALWSQARQGWIDHKLATPEQIPEQYDEAWVTKTYHEGMTVSQQIEAAQKAAADVLARRKQAVDEMKAMEDIAAGNRDDARADAAAIETHRHNVATEGIDRTRVATATANARERQKPGDDDPSLPRGVRTYLASLPTKQTAKGAPYGLADARTEVQAQMPTLLRDHPRLDATKVDAELRKMFPRDNPQLAGLFGGTDDDAPVAADTKTPPASTARPTPHAAPPAPAKVDASGGARAITVGGRQYREGDAVTVKGKQYRMKTIHPDGSWDPVE